MKANKILILASASLLTLAACTKLDPVQRDSIVSQGSNITDVTGLLNNTYNDLNGLLHNQDQLFSLEETVSDEALIPTRGGDWDDNGVWRVLHAHTWDVTHTQSQTVFTALGKLESDATTVLAFNPTAEQAAQAVFLRCLAQFYFVDLYGQVPYRTVANYNTIDAPPVMSAEQAIDSLVQNLTAIIPVLNAANSPYKASPDAARFLLMKVLLNKQAFLNKQNPAAADAGDMATVITLGNLILNNSKYKLTPHYFDNFGPNNGGSDPVAGFDKSYEMILAYPNLPGIATNAGIGAAGIDARWMMTLHYNSWGHKGDPVYGGAGWNGFSTVADFYNAFDPSDSMRRGNVFYPGVTDSSGLKVGFLLGPQLDEKGAPRLDRNQNPLTFNATVNLIEPDPLTLEGNGIRVIKYPPDYQHYSGGQQGNQLQIFRYADALLMVAEAHLRSDDAAGTGASLTLVNQLRTARKAAPLAGPLKLVNSGNLYDANTMLAERGKEMYWESWRRQDLIRFGVFLQPWALKTADDPKYLLFPIPATQLVANPHLKQNPGY
ncbi:RagB/SusD family nutrient uptake outer membrane protein [Puia sp.]|jgi:hypothetical protein|uniref:RagB/SusD family nutrient uptake outer membrane protein n=1 Tax=Puia sp. TaxID=2045100 RepID=UPI002F3FB3AB